MIREMSSENYIHILHLMHTMFRPSLYLEIGVATGTSLSLALPGSHAIGVDPKPHIQHPLRAWTQVFTLTSDIFFSQYIGKPFDLIFIDGLHHYEALVKDFINTEKFCKRSSIILLHDTIPFNAETATQTETPVRWTGDVWKIVPALRKGRPDLNVFTIGCQPTGLTVITGFNEDFKGIPEDIFKEFQDKSFEWLAADMKKHLNVVSGNANVWLPLLKNIGDFIHI